jgi:hypothetical protein
MNALLCNLRKLKVRPSQLAWAWGVEAWPQPLQPFWMQAVLTVYHTSANLYFCLSCRLSTQSS